MIFIGICNVFVSSGFGTSLVQKQDADDLDFSTLFCFSIIIGVFLYIVMFISAPLIANYFEIPILKPVICVMSLRLPLAGINTIQQAYVQRNMILKKFFFATLGGTITSAIVGITMAYMGFGVWALVAQYLTNTTIGTVILGFTIDWKPKLMFSVSRLKPLYSFGWKVLAASLITTLYDELRSIVIGKKYSSTELAYYNKGVSLPSLIITNINGALTKVMFPMFTRSQLDATELKRLLSMTMKMSTFILSPLLIGMAAVAEPMIRILFTDKWIDCVPYVRIFCVTYIFMPMHTINIQAIQAVGRSDISLKVEILKKIVGLVILLASIIFFDSPVIIAASFAVYAFIALVINAYPGKKLYGYSIINQLTDIMPPLLLSSVMGVGVYAVSFIIHNDIILLITQVSLGAVIYISGVKIFKFESFNYLIALVKGFLHDRKAKTA